MKFRMLAAAVAMGFAAATTAVTAQDFPTRPVTLMIPFSAGGPTDVIARLLAQKMTDDLGEQVLVENKTGAGGTIASRTLANADADGYTMLLHHMGIATSVSLYDLSYDPLTSFDYIGQVTTVPMLLVGRPDHPANTLPELLEIIRKDPGATMLANAGPGAVSHLCGMLFMNAIGAQVTTVPYQGTGPAMTDLLGSQVDLLCDQTTGASNNVKAGAVKAFAAATAERIPTLPDLPTAKEQGLDGFEIGVWHGVFVPAGTPEPVMERLNASLRKALQDPEIIERFAELGTAPVPMDDVTPESLEAKYTSEIEFWRPLIEKSGEHAN